MRLLVTITLLLFTSAAAGATTITVTYGGFINATFGSGNPAEGETFSGVYAYDDTEPDNDPGNPLHGDYLQAVGSHSISFSGGTVRIADIPSAVELYLDSGGQDRYRANGLLNGVAVWSIDLFDNSATALASDALVPPVLGLFDNPTFFFSEVGSSEGTVTSLLVTVPEPTSALLVAAGFVGLAGIRRRHLAE